MPTLIDLIQKDITLSAAQQEDIKAKAAHLEHFYDRITRIRITVEGPSPHHRKGHYSVKVDVHVPGSELVVQKEDTEDLHIALREAFQASARRVEDHVRRRRGFVKHHEE